MGSPRTSVEIREDKPDIEWIEKHIKGMQYSLSCIVDFTLNTELEIITSLSGFSSSGRISKCPECFDHSLVQSTFHYVSYHYVLSFDIVIM